MSLNTCQKNISAECNKIRRCKSVYIFNVKKHIFFNVFFWDKLQHSDETHKILFSRCTWHSHLTIYTHQIKCKFTKNDSKNELHLPIQGAELMMCLPFCLPFLFNQFWWTRWLYLNSRDRIVLIGKRKSSIVIVQEKRP